MSNSRLCNDFLKNRKNENKMMMCTKKIDYCLYFQAIQSNCYSNLNEKDIIHGKRCFSPKDCKSTAVR